MFLKRVREESAAQERDRSRTYVRVQSSPPRKRARIQDVPDVAEEEEKDEEMKHERETSRKRERPLSETKAAPPPAAKRAREKTPAAADDDASFRPRLYANTGTRGAVFKQVAGRLRALYEEYQKRRAILPKWKMINPTQRKGNSLRGVGDQRIEKLQWYLNQNYWINGEEYRMDKNQKLFSKETIKACLPLIYGQEFAKFNQRILQQHDIIGKIASQLFMCTPRRFGKTTVVSWICAALLLTVPGISIAVFSTGRRASTMMLDKVYDFVVEMGGASRVARHNQENLYISSSELESGMGQQSAESKSKWSDGSTSKLNSYPSSIEGRIFVSCVLWRRGGPQPPLVCALANFVCFSFQWVWDGR